MCYKYLFMSTSCKQLSPIVMIELKKHLKIKQLYLMQLQFKSFVSFLRSCLEGVQLNYFLTFSRAISSYQLEGRTIDHFSFLISFILYKNEEAGRFTS